MTTSVVPKTLACATAWFRTATRVDPSARIAESLERCNSDRGAFRGLAYNACDRKILGIHPDAAANVKLGRVLE